MNNINFFTADRTYVDYLKGAELISRGFTRVPDMEYGPDRKQKFLCGSVLRINGLDYFVPVTSYKRQQPDNLLIRANSGEILGSLRFNYMVPVPRQYVTERRIDSEVDDAYRSLLSKELQFCICNSSTIYRIASHTYHRVLLGRDKNLQRNSCDFRLLEKACQAYLLERDSPFRIPGVAPRKLEDLVANIGKEPGHDIPPLTLELGWER